MTFKCVGIDQTTGQQCTTIYFLSLHVFIVEPDTITLNHISATKCEEIMKKYSESDGTAMHDDTTQREDVMELLTSAGLRLLKPEECN